MAVAPARSHRFWPVDAAESGYAYRTGGFHPVHFGDTFANGRYTVVNKLGFGASSTTWLVRDGTTGDYCALKIISAKKSERNAELAVFQHLAAAADDNDAGRPYVAHMFDHFMHDGPNGRHQCIVQELLGPSIFAPGSPFMLDDAPPVDLVHRTAGQLVLAVRYLHKHAVAHGDLHAGNILMCLPAEWTSTDIEREMGEGCEADYIADGSSSPHYPKYLVPAASIFEDFVALFSDCRQIKLCDFSDSYIPNLFVAPSLVTPRILCPPDVLLSGLRPHATPQLDIWALAVMLHMLVAGGDSLFCRYPNQLILGMVLTLGKLPEPLWSMWSERHEYFDEDGNAINKQSKSFFKGLMVNDVLPVGGKERTALEDLLRQMARYDEHARISAANVVESYWVQKFCIPSIRASR